MKQINYSGSSKLISRIVHLLNRKAPLPLDGDGDPSWGTNGQVLTTDGTGATYWSAGGGSGDSVTWTQTQASGTKIAEIDINGTSQNVYVPTAPTVNDGTLTIQQNGTTVGTFSANQSGNTTVNLTGGSGSGGHTIEDTSGTDLPQEDNLQFVGVYTRDDSTNSRTEVNIVRQMTKAAMQALSSAEKEGFIDTTDEDDDYIPISAEDVKYGNTDVESALDGKVDKSGDTMTGILNIHIPNSDGDTPLFLKRPNSALGVYINFENSNGVLGYIGVSADKKPVFYDTSQHRLSMRTVTKLVNESVNLAQSGSKTYATLTTTYLSQFDEVTFLCNWGSPVGALVMTKAMISKTATVYGNSGAVGISSGSHYGSFTFGSSGMVVRNGSSSTMVSLLVEGITY